MAEVKMIANRKHEAFNCNGKAHSIIEAGESFTCDEGRALRLSETGVAHYDLAADEDVQPIPVVEPVSAKPSKVDGRTKAGRAHKGR